MIFRTIDLTNGVSVVTNGTNLTRITFANTGIYNLQFSSQFQNLSNLPQDVTIWLRLNGVDVSGSSGVIGLEARKNPGDPYHTVSGWNYLLNVVAGQYYELVWSTTDHTNVTMHYYSAGSPPPSAASVILTVTQQSGIMAGTGITAINSLTGAAQTLTTGTTGTDFSISSTGTTHTFNLPTASAANRGALSSTDWNTFNGKFNLPSLTSGSVLFSNGTTIAQDNANLFWDDTNNRLGIGTITPAHGLNVYTTIADTGILLDSNTNPAFIIKRAGVERLKLSASGAIGTVNGLGNGLVFQTDSAERMRFNPAGNLLINTTTDNGGKLQIKAPGALSTDIALRVRNSADSLDLFQVNGLGNIGIGTNTPAVKLDIYGVSDVSNGLVRFMGNSLTEPSFFTFGRISTVDLIVGSVGSAANLMVGTVQGDAVVRSSSGKLHLGVGYSNPSMTFISGGNVGIGTNAPAASSKLDITSTTQGVLFPRMTTTQKNAIASPSTGLVVFDTTLNKLCVRGASAWETITSI